MKTRLITGIIYVAILIAFFCLKFFVPVVGNVPIGDFCFDVLIYAFALIGTSEMFRALKDKMTKAERVLGWIFTIITIPVCALCEWAFGNGLWAMGACIFLFALVLLCLLVVQHKDTTVESLGLSLLTAVYPTMMLGLLVLANHLQADGETLEKFALDSRIVLLMIFVISPCSDTIAYVFGVCFRKWLPKKMAPELSPNKTVIGGVGGLVGGMLGAAALYFLYNMPVGYGSYDQMYLWLPIYIGIGFLTSLATMFGDLVESSLKRKLGIKDMGKLLPGHGGILDRIDGTLFATVIVYSIFAAIHMIL